MKLFSKLWSSFGIRSPVHGEWPVCLFVLWRARSGARRRCRSALAWFRIQIISSHVCVGVRVFVFCIVRAYTGGQSTKRVAYYNWVVWGLMAAIRDETSEIPKATYLNTSARSREDEMGTMETWRFVRAHQQPAHIRTRNRSFFACRIFLLLFFFSSSFFGSFRLFICLWRKCRAHY